MPKLTRVAGPSAPFARIERDTYKLDNIAQYRRRTNPAAVVDRYTKLKQNFLDPLAPPDIVKAGVMRAWKVQVPRD